MVLRLCNYEYIEFDNCDELLDYADCNYCSFVVIYCSCSESNHKNVRNDSVINIGLFYSCDKKISDEKSIFALSS